MENQLQTCYNYASIVPKSKIISGLMPILCPADKIPDTYVKAAVKGMDGLTVAFLLDMQNGSHMLFPKASMYAYGMTLQEIFDHVNHTNYGFRFAPMADFLGFSGEEDPTHDIFHVLTNEKGCYGAAAITNPIVLQQLKSYFKRSFYILPSSIHEVLLMPIDTIPDITPDELATLVQGINQSIVEEKDWLSDHVYLFDYEQDCIRTVA